MVLLPLYSVVYCLSNMLTTAVALYPFGHYMCSGSCKCRDRNNHTVSTNRRIPRSWNAAMIVESYNFRILGSWDSTIVGFHDVNHFVFFGAICTCANVGTRVETKVFPSEIKKNCIEKAFCIAKYVCFFDEKVEKITLLKYRLILQ